MSKIKTVILHVGLHKTASTSIQNSLFFYKNNKILEENGFIYPKSWPANHSIPLFNMFSDNPENCLFNVRMGCSKEEIKNKNEYYSKILVQEITKKRSSNLIISGEDITFLSEKNLISLKEYIYSICGGKVNIRVIVYARNPISWGVSAIQEEIKGENFTLERGLIVYKMILKNHFKSRIGNLIQVFGKESVEVYSFENAIDHKFGPVGHFLSVVGFNDNQISKFNIISANEGISQITANLISYINEKVPPIMNGKINEERILGDTHPLFKVRGNKFDIAYSHKKELLEIAKENIQWLKENVGIDYSDIEIQPSNNFGKQLSKETIEDIRKVFPELTNTIKSLTVEYFNNQLTKTKDNVDRELIQVILEGVVNKTLYDKEYNIVNVEKLPIIYRLENRPINISKDVIQIEQTPVSWFIEADGNDPYFTLPKFDVSKNKGILFVKITITSTVNTVLQLFYKSDNIQFDQNHSIRRKIDKGYNELIFQINQSIPIKELRLDPGSSKGFYLLHGLEIRIPKIS